MKDSGSGNRPVAQIPLIEEDLRVDKVAFVEGVVTVKSAVETSGTTVHENLESSSIRVERVPKDQLLVAAPTTQVEGNRTIVPVFEEVMVKRIRLIEEVHLIREVDVRPFEENFSLRRMSVSVERQQVDEDKDERAD